MLNSIFKFVTILISIHTILSSPQGRIIDGNVVDTLQRFPHHVTISRKSVDVLKDCSGSIVNESWILTSMNCVSGKKFTIHFRTKTINDSKHSFAVTLDETSVVPYPTGYDNIALIKLPVSLRFSEDLAPIPYSRSTDEAHGMHYNGFVVMPGFSPHSDELTYGMFRLISPRDCKARYGKAYDEYLQICTLGWNKNNQVPCEGNEGGGLVIRWPQQPRLIGIFTSSMNCVADTPAIYVNLAQYERWIDEMIAEDGPIHPHHYYWK